MTGEIYDSIGLPQNTWAVARLPDEAARWQQSTRDYNACFPTWRSVPGGRASHAFMDGDEQPLCGIRAPKWGSPRRRQHSRCEVLAATESSRRLTELHERQRREMPWEGP